MRIACPLPTYMRRPCPAPGSIPSIWTAGAIPSSSTTCRLAPASRPRRPRAWASGPTRAASSGGTPSSFGQRPCPTCLAARTPYYSGTLQAVLAAFLRNGLPETWHVPKPEPSSGPRHRASMARRSVVGPRRGLSDGGCGAGYGGRSGVVARPGRHGDDRTGRRGRGPPVRGTRRLIGRLPHRLAKIGLASTRRMTRIKDRSVLLVEYGGQIGSRTARHVDGRPSWQSVPVQSLAAIAGGRRTGASKVMGGPEERHDVW